MKINVANATFATLSLTLDMIARQRVFHNILLKSICETDEKYMELVKQIDLETEDEIELLRAHVFQFADVNFTDYINGTYDI